jgi:hypothetical protein
MAQKPGEASQPRPIGPRVISSIEEAMVARRAPVGVGTPETRAVEQLLQAMRTVKAARFCAANRFERKQTLSLLAMSIVSLYFVGLSVWQAIYASLLDASASRLITLVSIMSSVFTLVLALIESMNDYKVKAHHMHACALAVNDLYQELKITRPDTAAAVQDFRRRYNDVVRGCPLNHARVDYLVARAERGAPFAAKAWAGVRYAGDVYALYGLALVVPPLVLLLFR